MGLVSSLEDARQGSSGLSKCLVLSFTNSGLFLLQVGILEIRPFFFFSKLPVHLDSIYFIITVVDVSGIQRHSFFTSLLFLGNFKSYDSLLHNYGNR